MRGEGGFVTSGAGGVGGGVCPSLKRPGKNDSNRAEAGWGGGWMGGIEVY